MPRYQYACTECGHDFEAVQSFQDDALTECPRCGGRLRKVFSAVGVVFKGSGFYRTDSRSSSASTTPSAKPAGETTKPAVTSSESTSSTTSSSSPAGGSSTGESAA